MTRRLPPLNAVRAFEAAARHLSFTRAAAELNVTQAAISHQIRGLEAWLGRPLFRRGNRTLHLTEAGRAYLPALRDALDRIAEATARLNTLEGGGPLTISTMASFAARWLLARLPRFQAKHPEIEVRLATTPVLVDFDRQPDVDLALRFGRGRYPGLRVELLLTEDVFPVCSPALLEGPHALRRPEDLARVPLLHDDHLVTWADWLDKAGLRNVDPMRGPRFNDANLLLQAAISGAGVALGRRVLVDDDLKAGRLVRPFDIVLPSEFAYYIVAPEHHFARPKVAVFRDWLLEEAAAYGTESRA